MLQPLSPRTPALHSRRDIVRLGLAAACASCVGVDVLGTTRASATAVTRSVAVIGDSLTLGTLRYQADAFSAVGWPQATIDAHGSRGVRTKNKTDRYTGLTAVDAIRTESGEPDVWVIALGTNDSGIYPNEQHPAIVRMMMDHLGAGHRVLWANIYRPDAKARQASWNNALATVAAERPDELFVFDWALLAAENKRWLAKDGVHCTAKGYEHRATAIAAAARHIAPIVHAAPRPPSHWPKLHRE
jgi:lysophospholipase L1-like esterase